MTYSLSANSSTEGVQHAKRRGRLSTDIEGVGGLRLGCKPFSGAIPYHLKRRYGIIAESTYKEEERILRRLAKVFEDLKAQGKVKSTDPRRIGREDIQEFLFWMRREGLDSTTQVSYISKLTGFLRTFRNFVIDEMRADGVRFPRMGRKPIQTIEGGDLATIFQSLEKMEGWRGCVARGAIALCFATGIRPKEARLARLEDLDLAKGRFFVRHPKGEGAWASPEWVTIIRQDMIPFLKDYLRDRGEHTREKGKDSPALFPPLGPGGGDFYHAGTLWKVKREAEELSGVSFRLKDFRSTLCTVTVNGDLSRLPAMSVQLRHDSTTTTQKFYANIERGQAGRQLKDVWKETPITYTKCSIQSKEDYTGYV